MVYFDVLWCTFWCTLMNLDVLWCTLMYFNVLLPSIVAFFILPSCTLLTSFPLYFPQSPPWQSRRPTAKWNPSAFDVACTVVMSWQVSWVEWTPDIVCLGTRSIPRVAWKAIRNKCECIFRTALFNVWKGKKNVAMFFIRIGNWCRGGGWTSKAKETWRRGGWKKNKTWMCESVKVWKFESIQVSTERVYSNYFRKINVQ